MKNEIAMEVYFTLLDEIADWARISWVEYACEERVAYNRMYEEMLQIRDRISQRLGAEDTDKDLEALLDIFESTQQTLCQQMFDCGVYYAQTIL